MSARNLQYIFDAIGTHWVLDAYGVPESVDEAHLYAQIVKCISDYDAYYSRFIPTSFISHIADTPGTYTLREDARPMIELYKKLYDITSGAVTPLIGTVLEEAGYDATYSLQPKKMHHPKKWEEVFSAQDPLSLTTEGRVVIDVGAAGKGYLVDIVATLMQRHGIVAFSIDAGGDILYVHPDGEPLVVGLENPHATDEVIGTVRVHNNSLCASAGSRRAWGEHHHVFNPHTLRSVSDVVATWALADSALFADGLATALFFVTPELLSTHFSFEYLVLMQDGSYKKSAGFPGEVFSA